MHEVHDAIQKEDHDLDNLKFQQHNILPILTTKHEIKNHFLCTKKGTNSDWQHQKENQFFSIITSEKTTKSIILN